MLIGVCIEPRRLCFKGQKPYCDQITKNEKGVLIRMDIQRPVDIREDTDLCRIMQEVGSDAAGPFHNYTKLYSTIFEPVRQEPLRILEIGLAPNPDISGAEPAAAIRGWRRYFPNATVVGADPSAEWVVPVEGASNYVYDWKDPSGIESIFDHDDTREPFDVLIYDGPGNYADKAVHFHGFARHVRVGGVIILEDIHWRESGFWLCQKEAWDKDYPHFSWRPISLPCATNRESNILMIAQVREAPVHKGEQHKRVEAAPVTNEVVGE